MSTFNFTTNESKKLGLIKEKRAIRITGDFGGGTLTIQHCDTPDGTYVAFDEGVFTTASELKQQVLEWSGYIQFTLSGATDPDLDVDVRIVQ